MRGCSHPRSCLNPWDSHQGGGSWLHPRKNSRASYSKVKEHLFREIHTLWIECGPSQKAREAPGYGAVSFHTCCVHAVKSHVRFFATLWTIDHQALLSIGFSRQDFWSGFPCPPPGDLPYPEVEPKSPVLTALQADSLPLSHWRSPFLDIYLDYKYIHNIWDNTAHIWHP